MDKTYGTGTEIDVLATNGEDRLTTRFLQTIRGDAILRSGVYRLLSVLKL